MPGTANNTSRDSKMTFPRALARKLRDFNGVSPQKVAAAAKAAGISSAEFYEGLNVMYQDHLAQERDAKKKEKKAARAKTARKVKQYEELVQLEKRRAEVTQAVRQNDKAFLQQLSVADQDYLMSLGVIMKIKYKGNDKIYEKSHRFDVVVKKKDAKRRAKAITEEHKWNLITQSGVTYAEPASHSIDLTKIQKNPEKLSKRKMKDACAFALDGEPEQVWDRKKGTCVFDFLIHRYGGIKGFKSVCTYESLEEIFKGFDEIEGKYMYESPLESGVCTDQVEIFCRRMGVPMYALDQDNYYFSIYIPHKPNHHAPSLVYKVLNNHFYPVVDNTKVRSIAKAVSNALTKTELAYTPASAKEPKEPKEAKYTHMHVFEGVDDPYTVLRDALCAKGKQPIDANIYYDGALKGFTLDNELYMINQDVELAKRVYAALGKPYNGQNINSALFDIIETVAKVKIPKSTPNPHVYDSLLQENVKARTHYGCVNGYMGPEVEALVAEGKAVCCDIAKCYSKCMYDPYDDWMLLDYNDCWEPFTGDFTRFGLYYAETNDTTMLTGNNIYTSAILMKAHAEGIPFCVKHQLLASKSAPRDLFKPILDAIKQVAGADKELMKKLNNMLSGYLGKHFKNYYKVHMNSDLEQVWNTFLKDGALEGKDIFVHPVPLPNENGKVYMYGQKFSVVMSEINIPMYIQIKDYANMRLYDMIKAMGGTLAYRKVDCAVTVGGAYPELSDEWGGYRESELPKMLGPQTRHDARFVETKPWNVHDVNDSSTWPGLLAIAREKGGLLIQGRAGTGKSYAATRIAQALERVDRVAPTNKAALNIKGKTIHKYLSMDKDGHLSSTRLDTIKKRTDYLVVDEMSMVTKGMWRRLVELKRATGVIFILVGDFRQCAPVENEKVDNYFDHSAVKYLANYNKVDLTVRHRYCKRLWDMLEDVEGVDTGKFGSKVCDRNICYYNNTRKRVNSLLMKKHAPESAIVIPADDKDEYTQKVWLYDGLPVIARLTVDGGEKMVNNEYFTVSGFKSRRVDGAIVKMVVCTNTRPGEDNEPVEHSVEVPLLTFQKHFLVNYCSTTHKAQGETITEDFTIWDWHAMDTKLKYTAMSRAKTPEQINFATMQRTKGSTAPRETIAKKLLSHKAADIKKGRDFDLDVEYVQGLICKQHGVCCHCHAELKLGAYGSNDERQFSIDRLDDSRGHVKGNVAISCWACNRSHANKKL